METPTGYGAKLRQDKKVQLAQRVLTLKEDGESFAVTKSEGSAGDFPAGDYAYVPDAKSPSTWKLRLTATPGGDPDPGIVGAAAAALGKGFRGNKVSIPAADRAAVVAKVRAAWHKANPDKKDSEMPDVLQASAVVAHGDWGPQDSAPIDSDDDFLDALLEHHEEILDLLDSYDAQDSDVAAYADKTEKAVRQSSADLYGLLAKIVINPPDEQSSDVQAGPGPMAYALVVTEAEFAGLPPALAAQLVKRLKASLAKETDPAKIAKLKAEIAKYGG